MDCRSAGTTAGIDPKVLNNWQPDAFSVKLRNQRGYNQRPEWDNSQGSSPNDADIMDQGSLRGPLDLDGSLFNGPNDYLNVDKYDLLLLGIVDGVNADACAF